MDANKFLPGGPGGPERVASAVIAAAASAATAGSLHHSLQTSALKDKQTESKHIIDMKERQHRATLEVDQTILNEGKTVTWARGQRKAHDITSQEVSSLFKALEIPQEAILEGGWDPAARTVEIKEASDHHLREIGVLPRNVANSKESPLRGGGDSSWEQERFTTQTVSVDPTPLAPSPAQVSYQRSIGIGIIVFFGSFFILRTGSQIIRKHRYSNNIAAWFYSAFSPPSEKFSDFSERTHDILIDLHEKLDRGAIRDEEILKLLKSLNDKLQ